MRSSVGSEGRYDDRNEQRERVERCCNSDVDETVDTVKKPGGVSIDQSSKVRGEMIFPRRTMISASPM